MDGWMEGGREGEIMEERKIGREEDRKKERKLREDRM